MTRENTENITREQRNNSAEVMIEEVSATAQNGQMLNFTKFLYIIVVFSTLIGYLGVFWGVKIEKGLFVLFGSLFLILAVLGLAFVMSLLGQLEAVIEDVEK